MLPIYSAHAYTLAIEQALARSSFMTTNLWLLVSFLSSKTVIYLFGMNSNIGLTNIRCRKRSAACWSRQFHSLGNGYLEPNIQTCCTMMEAVSSVGQSMKWCVGFSREPVVPPRECFVIMVIFRISKQSCFKRRIHFIPSILLLSLHMKCLSFDSFSSGKSGSNCDCVISEQMFMSIAFLLSGKCHRTHLEKSYVALAQVMVWCCQVTSQYWFKSIPPCVVGPSLSMHTIIIIWDMTNGMSIAQSSELVFKPKQ